jgi:hypothetical protein
MTTASSGARIRSLQDDLLEDLRQAPARSSAAPHSAAGMASPGNEPAPALPDAPTPVIEVRVTPRCWSPVGWTRQPDGGGLTVSLGPVCLSLGRLHR